MSHKLMPILPLILRLTTIHARYSSLLESLSATVMPFGGVKTLEELRQEVSEIKTLLGEATAMKNPEKDGKPEVETWVQDCEEIDDRIVAVRPELKRRGGFVIFEDV
jgi:hypothetical protein